MLKTIQMQKAKPTQKQNKKPTHNAGKITKKKLKKPRFIGGAKKNISELSIKEKLEFLKHCLNNTIHSSLKAILYTANPNALIDFPKYADVYITEFKTVIKYVLLCLINNSTNNEYKDTVRSNNCYLLLKKNCPGNRCQYSIDFESEKDLDSKEEELNKIADKYYNRFEDYVSNIVKNPHEITINQYIKAIYPGGIAILTKYSDKYHLNINNSETQIEENSIIEFLNKKNKNTEFLIILKKEDSDTDVYNCMMQIIMKLVDIFSSENNSNYYEMIIKGTDENDVYELMKGNALRERLNVAQEERLILLSKKVDNNTITHQGEQQVETSETPPETPAKAPETTAQTAQTAQTAPAKAPAKAPETQETPAKELTTAQTTAKAAEEAAKAAKEAEAEAAKEKAKAIAAAAKVEEEANAKAEKVEKEAKEEAEKAKAEKAKKAETIKKRAPGINLDNLLDYIFNGGAQVFDLGKHAILLKSLKMICYNKFSKEIGITFKDQIDKKYIAKIDEKKTYPESSITRIINDSKLVYLLTKQGCNSNDMIEAYQHIINILVPKYGLDITEECYETLIALSDGMTDNDCKTTIGDILTQKNYLLSEPKIKDLLIRKYLKDLGNFKSNAIDELNKFKDKVLNILNEIFDVPAYKETESKVLKIYNSLRDIIVKDYEGNRDLIGVLDDDIVHIYRITKNSKTYSNIQKTPEEIKFDKLLDIIFKIFKIFQDIKTITGKSFSYTKHGIILRSLKLICYNKLNKLFRNYSDHIDRKYIDKLNEMGFNGKNIESNESFKIHKAIDGISGTQYCNDIEMIQAYKDIINILYQGKRIPEIEDINISLLIELSTGYLTPDCKKTINKIINDESYLLSESRIMDIELNGDFIITSWHKNKTYSSEDEAVLALTKYNETITKAIKKATNYDIKNKLWKDYDDLSKKIKSKYTDNSNIAGALPAIPAINKPETKKMTKRGETSMRIMATNIRRL